MREFQKKKHSRTEELKHAIEYCQTNKCRGYAAMNANNYKYICDPKAISINKYLDRKRLFENRFHIKDKLHFVLCCIMVHTYIVSICIRMNIFT